MQGHGLPGLGKPVRLFCMWENGVPECGALALSLGGCCPPVLLCTWAPSQDTTEWGLEHCFSQCWGWKTETRVSAWLAPGESRLPGWHTAAFPRVLPWRRE